MFVVCFCTCLSADFWLTMWMKSTGVAVYKSQCSLSRMILSMRRISAVEKLHPLCITRSLMEPITCVKRHKTKKGINIVLNELCCHSRSILTSSSSLILAARTREVNAMHLRYFGWAWKTPRDSGSGSLLSRSHWPADVLSLNVAETPSSCSQAFYLDSGQQAVQDADSQCRGVWTEVEEPAHLSQPKDHFSELRWRDVCALRRRRLSVRTTACLKLTRPENDSPGWIRFWRQAPSRGGLPSSGPPPAGRPVGASPQPLGASWCPESKPGWIQGTNTWQRREVKTQVTKATFRR